MKKRPTGNASRYAVPNRLLAAAEALLAAKDAGMVTVLEWRALRRAVRTVRKAR